MHETDRLAGGIDRRQLRGEGRVVARGGFEEELADRLQMCGQRIECLAGTRVVAQRAIGRDDGLRRLDRSDEAGQAVQDRIARAFEAVPRRFQPLRPVRVARGGKRTRQIVVTAGDGLDQSFQCRGREMPRCEFQRMQAAQDRRREPRDDLGEASSLT